MLVEVELPRSFADGVEAQRAVQFHDIAKNYGPLADAHPDVISAKLAEVIGLGRKVSETSTPRRLPSASRSTRSSSRSSRRSTQS